MRYIQRIFRHQLQLSNLEDKITADNRISNKSWGKIFERINFAL